MKVRSTSHHQNEWPRVVARDRASRLEREAMSTIHRDGEKGTEREATTEHCDDDWCGGPESDTLPCFDCFDRSQEYQHESDLDEAGA